MRILHGLYPVHGGRFLKWSHFSNIWCFCDWFIFTEQLYMICRMDFDMSFGVLIFDPKCVFCMRYSLCIMADFQNGVISRVCLVFFRAVFCTKVVQIICRIHFDTFFGILVFDLKWGFCMGYSLWIMADFQNGLISRIFGVFSSSCLHRTTLNDL